MLHADLVVSTDDRPLQQAPDALNPVRMDIPTNPFLFRVIDALVAGIRIGNSLVGGKLVGVDRLCLGISVIRDELVKRGLVRVGDDLQANLPLPLDGSDRDGLVTTVAAAHAARLAAHISLVNLHDALQKFTVGVPHGRADTVAEVPRRLIGDVERALHLEGTDAFLALGHQVDRQKPLGQRKVCVVKNRARRNRKVIVAPVAVELLAGRDFRDDGAVAARAANASRPAKSGKPFAALVVVAVLLDELNEVNFGFHVRLRFAGCAWMRHKAMKSKKKANEMTDEELLHSLFPKKLIRKLKKVAHKARKKGKK